MTTPPRSEVTRILLRLGDDVAQTEDSERLLELLYDELRRSARALMSRERAGHTLQPTALVHEAYLRLVHQDQVQWADRVHFLAVAARCMRNILIDHARAKKTAKRGGEFKAITLDEGLVTDGNRDFEMLLLNDAITKLSKLDERAARVVEMRLFGGMSVKEIGHALDVSPRTVDTDWATARLWLSRELKDD